MLIAYVYSSQASSRYSATARPLRFCHTWYIAGRHVLTFIAPSEAIDSTSIAPIPVADIPAPWEGAPPPTRLPPSSFGVRVPSSTVVQGPKPYATYTIEFQLGDARHCITERYSELLKIHDALRATGQPLPDFPGKKLFGNMTEENLRKERQGLFELYYNALAHNMHVLKLPLFASLYKLPEQFQSDLIAYADHMIKRQVESANASATFHKTHPSFTLPYNVVLQFLGEKTAIRGPGGVDWFRISKISDPPCLLLSNSDPLYHFSETVRLNHAKCTVWRLWPNPGRERVAVLTRKRNGLLQLKLGKVKGAYHRVLWQGEWDTPKDFVFPFPDGKGKAFQAAVASEALMREHFSACFSETKGVGIEVFAGQDIALIAVLVVAMSRLNSLGTRGAATAYVPSTLLGAFHYFSGGYSRGSEEAWRHFEAKTCYHTTIALLKATHDCGKGQDDKLKHKELCRVCRLARPSIKSPAHLYEIFETAHSDNWCSHLDRKFYHEQRAHKQSEARLHAAQARINSLMTPVSQRPEDIRHWEMQRNVAIAELDAATRELQPPSMRTSSLTIVNPTPYPIPICFGGDLRFAERDIVPPGGSQSWMLMPGEMVQVLSPDSALVLDRIIMGQYSLVLSISQTGQLVVLQT